MRIGIFGGTFDPPHLGHLILADEARIELELAQIYFVLTPNPPHKQGITVTSVEIRLEMLAKALSGEPSFVISRVDLDRDPPHFAVDTVEIFREMMPGTTLVYLMGGDSLRDLPTWHHPVDFVDACDLIGVMSRPQVEVDIKSLAVKVPGIITKLRFIDAPLLEISSSDLRWKIANGEPYRFYLRESVWKFIQSKKLYRE
ncbi:MAG: nicotinate (nicotinamide) nucleotide adenylyltransferase [Anaerolineales bacterium]|nr:MAG: nicotinate (nicotinamide) nucleotide adenylyltransferase [Anaerolineales bacterium]